jgi:hypothetical protein
MFLGALEIAIVKLPLPEPADSKQMLKYTFHSDMCTTWRNSTPDLHVPEIDDTPRTSIRSSDSEIPKGNHSTTNPPQPTL